MKIGIDIMGGDFAPKATILGSINAAKLIPDNTIVCVGDQKIIEETISEEGFSGSNIEIVHASQVIEMGEHPAKAFPKKPDSSIAVGYKLLATNQIQGFCGVGNSGAMMVGALYSVKQIPGVIRPCAMTVLPRINGRDAIILDVGINVDCKPDVLYQYGIIGSIYAKNILKVENPGVGLLNIGSEEEKGNLQTRATYNLMKDNNEFNFIGNVEGNDIFKDDSVDVIVCDGFTGNVVLKLAESIYSLVKRRNVKDEYFDRFNFESYGGTPILGINANVTIGHGISNVLAIQNMILQTKKVVEVDLSEKIKERFK